MVIEDLIEQLIKDLEGTFNMFYETSPDILTRKMAKLFIEEYTRNIRKEVIEECRIELCSNSGYKYTNRRLENIAMVLDELRQKDLPAKH